MAEDYLTICNKLPETAAEILRCEVGSSAHGVSLAGTDDFDMMAIAVEKPRYVLGTGTFEHKIYRTAEIREGKKSVPSQPGDIDLAIYSLRKYARLAAKGNPTVLLALYGPVLTSTWAGALLRQNRHLFMSKQVGKSFLGYMQAQRERLEGKRGQMRVTRKDLIDQFGFDTKYAMHVLRLGYQGVQLMSTGTMPVPIDDPFRKFLIGVRLGHQDLKSVLGLADVLEGELKALSDNSDWPEQPHYTGIDCVLTEIYSGVWEDEGYL
jgi:uncharacterized protein